MGLVCRNRESDMNTNQITRVFNSFFAGLFAWIVGLPLRNTVKVMADAE